MRVAVALPDASRIDERRSRQHERIDAILVRHRPIRHPKDSGHMRVAVKAHRAFEKFEVGVSHFRVENVLIDVIARTGMYQQHVVLDVAVRQPPQPFQPLLSDHLNCPTNNGRGVVVEPFEDFGIGARAIVVSHEGEPLALHDFIHATLRIAAITDDVAQAQRLVDRWAVARYRLERLPVGVNVGEERYLQTGLS